MTFSGVIVYGAGGFGRETAQMIEHHTDYEFLGFYDDDRVKVTVNILETTAALVIAIASPNLRKHVVESLSSPVFCNVVSSRSNLGQARMGLGNIVCSGVEGTVNIVLGDHVIINLNVTIGHDVFISSFCSIMPSVNISGSVQIGEQTLIGSGATILQGITIGKNCVIGAGAVVTSDIPDNCTAVGVPAKIIKRNA